MPAPITSARSLFDADVLAHLAHDGVVAGNLIATLTLAMLVLISLVLVGATIVVPLQSTVNRLAVGRGRHLLFRPDRDRLHDGRDRSPAADERLPRSSYLCPERRSVQPDPLDGRRQHDIRAGAACRGRQARRLERGERLLPVCFVVLAAAAPRRPRWSSQGMLTVTEKSERSSLQSACNEFIDQVQSSEANSASGVGRVRPVIVGRSTRHRPLLPRPINDNA
jgi:hypothetical protein